MVPVQKSSLNTHYTNTHDRFFRSCFKDMDYTRSLLKFWLPQNVQDVLDISGLLKQDTSLPTISKEADLLLRGYLKSTRPIYILLEHKNQRSLKKVCSQMADYGVAIKHFELSKTPKERPIVLNCIFYHGKSPWQKMSNPGLDVVMYDIGAESIDSILLQFHVLDLRRLDEALWPPKGALYSILYALLKVQQLGDTVRDVGREFFRKCLSHLDEKDARQLGPCIASYIASVYNLTYEEVWSMAKSSGAKDLSFFENWEKIMGNPWKEDGRKQGRVEGLETGLKKGLEKGRAEVAMNMLKEGADVAFVMKVTGLSADEIEPLKKA